MNYRVFKKKNVKYCTLINFEADAVELRNLHQKEENAFQILFFTNRCIIVFILKF